MVEGLLLLALVLMGAAVLVQEDWRPVRRWLAQHRRAAVTSAPVPAAKSAGALAQASEGPDTAPGIKLLGPQAGTLRVLDADELLQVTGAAALLQHLYRHSKLSRTVFDRDFLPAIRAYAEFVQLLPASESHHHAHVGGLLAHTLETVHHALVLRGGRLLAHAAGAEAMDAQRDHWTYGVFFGALLHDVGKPLADLRVDLIASGSSAEPVRWMPLAGTMLDCHAQAYHVEFAPREERDYTAHTRMSLLLLQRLVPATARGFLARCPEAMSELTQYLGGDARGGAIASIVSEADQRSTAANLATGSRARFGTARSVPLVEQLMSAIQAMLAQGGHLPLNRDGAAGWVYDGSVWFTAKRLADGVREFIQARAGEGAGGIPGENKNDRLFDAWMEYGQLQVNPATQKAIWHVRVHGEDGAGYSHELSMLRFPLAKLWADPSQYPAPMVGRIEVLASRAGRAKAEDSKDAPRAQAAELEENEDDDAVPEAPGAASSAPMAGANASRKASPSSDAIPSPVNTSTLKGRPRRSAAPASSSPYTVSEFLPVEDTARASAKAMAAERAAPGLAPDRAPLDSEGAEALERVALPQARSVPSRRKGNQEPTEAAVAFMRWVQQGLGDGSLKYNEVGAQVHFVEGGIALVSPALFREYALTHGEPPSTEQGVSARSAAKSGLESVGLQIQREVLRAGWHLPNPATGANIWTFTVARRGGAKTGKLSAVVLEDAKRWVMEPPPPNPALQLPSAEQGAEA